jgi:hypothetical protein
MKLSTRLAPQNSLLLIMDHAFGEVPESMGGNLVAFTNSCVALGTLAQHDGETTVMLADALDEDARGEIVFDGVLETPSRELSVCDVTDAKLLTLDVAWLRTRVQVFANDLREPDEIVVVASSVVEG